MQHSSRSMSKPAERRSGIKREGKRKIYNNIIIHEATNSSENGKAKHAKATYGTMQSFKEQQLVNRPILQSSCQVYHLDYCDVYSPPCSVRDLTISLAGQEI